MIGNRRPRHVALSAFMIALTLTENSFSGAIAFLLEMRPPECGPLLREKVDHASRSPLASETRWSVRSGLQRTSNELQAEARDQQPKNLFDYIREEDVDTLRRYVEGGGTVHVADALGDTSLMMAASTGNAEVVKVLASGQDAEVNYPCFHGGETPLMLACTRGYLAVAECLVEAGARVNATNHRGDTALSLAAFWGKLDCLQFLLSLPDIDTEIQNVQGKRAGEDVQELMRDDSKDERTLTLLREHRIRLGITRL